MTHVIAVNKDGYRPQGNMCEAWRDKSSEMMISGPAECIAGETLIYDHATGLNISIEDLCKTQTAPIVKTLFGYEQADIPFCKGVAELFRVTLDDGRSFLATKNHYVLSSSGWLPVSSLRISERLFLSDASHPQTSSELALSTPQQGDHRFLSKAQDYQSRYDPSPYHGGGQPLPWSEACQDASPSQAYAHGHNHGDHNLDDRGASVKHTHPRQLSGHQSSAHSLTQNSLSEKVGEESHCEGYMPSHDACLFQQSDQFQKGNSHSLPSLEAKHHFFHMRSLLPPDCNYTVHCGALSSIEYERTDKFYDMTVPYSGHYIVDGIIHHNTGKSFGALHKLNALCCIYPNTQAAIVRKVQSSMYGTVLTSFQKKVLARPDSVRVVGKLHPERFIYPNGSEIWVAGIDNPSKSLSSERDFIYVNQAEELTISDWEYLLTRTTGRAGNAPYSLLFGDCNPDAPTHWIRTRSKKGGTLRLIPTVHKDNPVLYDVDGNVTEQGKKTIKLLQTLTGARRQRLYLGMWVAPEGAIYDAFIEDRHTCAAFEIPTSWPRFVGIDPFGAFISAVWMAWEEEHRKLHVYREYYEPFGVSTPTHVSNIIRDTGSETVFAWVGGGPSERQARTDFANSGIPLMQPPIADVWAGIDRVNQLIIDDAIIVHDSCPTLLTEIGSYRRSVVNGQPTERIKDKDDFHMLDALRYVVAYLTDGQMARVVYDPVEIGRDW